MRAQGECIVARSMLKQQDRRVHARHWVKRLAGNPHNDGGHRSRLHKCGEVRPVTGCGRDALRHLQLHQQDDACRGRCQQQEPMQQWTRDVIRNVGNHAPAPTGWCERLKINGERIAMNEG